MNLTLANPIALCGAVLAVPIVWLSLRQPRLPHQTVAATWLWQQALAIEPARQRWHPYRGPVSLAVSLVILGLVVLALADPRVGRPQRLVVIVDNSVEQEKGTVSGGEVEALSARHGPLTPDPSPARGEGRKEQRSRVQQAAWCRVQQAALRRVAAMGDADQAVLLSVGSEVRVHCGLTSDRRALLESIASIGLAHGPAHWAEALTLARRVLEAVGGGRIAIVSEGAPSQAALPTPAEDVDWIAAAEVADSRPPASIEALAAPRARLGWWLMAVAGLLVVLEWPFYQRRWMS